MLQAITARAVNLSTRGRLIGTTDLKQARNIGKVYSVADLIGSRPGHYERVDNSLLIWVGQELYELGAL